MISYLDIGNNKILVVVLLEYINRLQLQGEFWPTGQRGECCSGVFNVDQYQNWDLSKCRLSTIQGCLFRGVLLYIYLMVKFYSYNPTNNFNIYLWNGVLLGQPFHNQHARLSQPCEVVNTLHEIPQTCDNLSRLQQGQLLQPRNFRMG